MNTEELKKLFREKYSYVVVDDDVLEQAIEDCKGMAQDEETLCWLIEDYIVSQATTKELETLCCGFTKVVQNHL